MLSLQSIQQHPLYFFFFPFVAPLVCLDADLQLFSLPWSNFSFKYFQPLSHFKVVKEPRKCSVELYPISRALVIKSKCVTYKLINLDGTVFGSWVTTSTLCPWGLTGFERETREIFLFCFVLRSMGHSPLGQKAAQPSIGLKPRTQSVNPPTWSTSYTLQPCSHPVTVLQNSSQTLAMIPRIAQFTACRSFAWWRGLTLEKDRILCLAYT